MTLREKLLKVIVNNMALRMFPQGRERTIAQSNLKLLSKETVPDMIETIGSCICLPNNLTLCKKPAKGTGYTRLTELDICSHCLKELRNPGVETFRFKWDITTSVGEKSWTVSRNGAVVASGSSPNKWEATLDSLEAARNLRDGLEAALGHRTKAEPSGVHTFEKGKKTWNS